MDSKINPVHLLQSRGSLFCCGVVVFVATVLTLCGPNSAACFSVIATDGVVALAWVTAATLLGMTLLAWFDFDFNLYLRVAASGGLGLGIFSLVGLGLGLAGWLNHPVAIGLPVLSVGLFVVDLLKRHPREIDAGKIRSWLVTPAGPVWLWLVPLVSLAIACVSASVMPGILWKSAGDPHPYDVTSYHLQVPREWYEGGRIVPLAHNVFSYFPFNVEMQFLLLMHLMGGPWAAMYACQFLNVGYAVFMVIGVAGAAEGERSTFNVQRSTFKEEASFVDLPVGGSLVAMVPWTIMLAGVAYVESALMLYTALSVAIAMKAIGQSKRLVSFFIFSGVMAGFAAGVKITAVPMLLIAVPVAAFVVLTVRKVPVKPVMIACSGLVLAGLIVLSPWLIRNFAWSGNPLFPVGMSALGRDHFTDQQVERFRVAHSPTASQQSLAGKVKVLGDGVILHQQYGWVLLPMSVVALATCWRQRKTWLLCICGVFVFVTWIGFTHLLPRFLVMLIPICGIGVGQIKWGRAWQVAVIVTLCAGGVGWSWLIPQLRMETMPTPSNGEERPALIGTDYNFMLAQSPELIEARNLHKQIALIGDTQAFLYQVPMSQLHYRSVFNIGAGDSIDAWIGEQVKGDPNWLLVINPMEIDRLHRTYFGVPPLPADWAHRPPQSFFIHGDDLKH